MQTDQSGLPPLFEDRGATKTLLGALTQMYAALFGSAGMTLDQDPTLPLNEAEASSTEAPEPARASRGSVEPCEFEQLLERAMEILKARRASTGSPS